MPSYTGTQICRSAVREAGIIDPVEAGHAELIEDARVAGTDLIDTWRLQKLTIAGVTRSVYSLTLNTQSYTIGTSTAAFGQDYPASIDLWSVIPDDDATDPVEKPRGKPLTYDQWQQIRVKSLTASEPTDMWFDRRYAAGVGNCLFYPIPDNGDVDVVLYSRIPAITSLVAATTYDLRHGYIRALKLGIALELAMSGKYAVPDTTVVKLERRFHDAFGWLKRANYIPREAPIRPEYIIRDHRRGNFNVRVDG